MLAFANPLVVLNGSFVATNIYDKIVRDQLIDALMTNQGERVMHPTWGCNVQAMLFDPAHSLERLDLASYIRNQLVQMVPRALIQSVEVNVSEIEPNKVIIDILYKTSTFTPAQTVSASVDLTASAAGV